MSSTEKFLVESDNQNQRLDIFLSEKLSLTRSQAQKLIDNSLVLVDGKLPKKAGDRLKHGYNIEVSLVQNGGKGDEEFKKTQKHKNTKTLEINILKETKDYAVIEKPAGLLVHPTDAKESETLTAWLLEKYPEIKKVGDSLDRPGIVHRLDKDASGLLVIARTQKMFEHLKKQFQDREIDKEYLVLVYGNLADDHGKIDFSIGRGEEGKMVARPKIDLLKVKNVGKVQPGKEALTEYGVEKAFARFTLLRVKIFTGRTHQIRVHMFAYNHPVVGDNLYFNKHLLKKGDQKLKRLFLHSAKLGFKDLHNEEQCFESELPEVLKDYLKNLK